MDPEKNATDFSRFYVFFVCFRFCFFVLKLFAFGVIGQDIDSNMSAICISSILIENLDFCTSSWLTFQV